MFVLINHGEKRNFLKNRYHMLKNYVFWFKTGAWMSLITGLVHSLNFLSKPLPQNDEERQLIELLENYQFLLPGGFERSTSELMLFFNLNMTFFLVTWAILGLMLGYWLMPTKKDRQIIGVSAAIWTAYLIPTYLLTFLIPLVLVALTWLCFLAGWITYRKPETNSTD